MESASDSENQLLVVAPERTSLTKKIVVAASVGATLLLAPAVVHLARPASPQVATSSSSDFVMEELIAAVPKMQQCATQTENCFGNKCCQTSGQTCWYTGPATAKCSVSCPPGSPCWVEKPWYAYKPGTPTGTTLFCYTLYAAMKGPSLTNTKDLDILKHQLSKGAGIFACDGWQLFSDKAATLGNGVSTMQVPITADYTKYTRKDKPDHYVNTPLFMGAWNILKAEGKYLSFDWVVKVDAPTVFLPWKLRAKLASAQDTDTGVYFVNCNKVMEGFFGNLEVSTKKAFSRFLEQKDSYYASSCWRSDTEKCKKEWKYGTWGEDLFMQRCMDDAGVAKLQDFKMSDSGTCPGMRPSSDKKNKSYVPTCVKDEFVAFHPFRTATEWDACYDAIK